MEITIKTGDAKGSESLVKALRERGWTNPKTIMATRNQTTVTIDVAPDYCSIPDLLLIVSEVMEDLRIGV